MVLGFNKRFEEPILAEIKLHTIREDKHGRWHAGRAIHMATGVRTKHYNCFKQKECISTQAIKFKWHEPTKKAPDRWCNILVSVNHCGYKLLSYREIERLAINDGFKTVADLLIWFNKDFKGKIIHWTNLKY